MGAALGASGVGGIIGVFVMALTIPIVRFIVLSFGPPEFLMMTVLGLTFISVMSSESLIKGLETIEISGVSGKAAFDDAHSYKWGYPYMDAARSQFQKDGQYAVLFPYKVAKESNPDKTFIPIKKLRKMQEGK